LPMRYHSKFHARSTANAII